MFNARNTYRGMTSTSSSWQSTSGFGHSDNYTRKDDVLPMTSTDEGTSNTADVGGVKNEEGIESDVNQIWECSVNGLEIALCFKPKTVPTAPENRGSNGEGPDDDAEKDPRFMIDSPLAHMHNVDPSVEDQLKFAELPHRRSGHAIYSLDLGDLEVGKKFSTKDGFVVIVKRYNIKNRSQQMIEVFSIKVDETCFSQLDIYVISDRGLGILVAIERQGSLWDCTHHRYEHVKNHFREILRNLRAISDDEADYLCNIPFKQWTQSYNGVYNVGIWQQNLAESINFILKEKRHLPVTSTIKETYFHFAELFPKRAMKYISLIDPTKGLSGAYHLHLKNRTCNCRRFDTLQFPYTYAITAYSSVRLDPMSFMDEVYKLNVCHIEVVYGCEIDSFLIEPLAEVVNNDLRGVCVTINFKVQLYYVSYTDGITTRLSASGQNIDGLYVVVDIIVVKNVDGTSM
ncbi:hypothetical protein GOBAR_AA36892 [Gossypium barbadense]|uniref:Uncharacterized protein n=1 Tax=Gossypium barbadense TaxID=3634 RepID=A0A2P5VY95_GOSBA|nr:hypothetical protein GOBAR_AA36892 [Gossypium barbadense]